jgi:3'(2'), 5'-bisphosphate nucleotidase
MLAQLELIAIEAGRLIEQFRRCGPNVLTKSDGSPVTDADEAAEDFILRELHKFDAEIPVIAEESCCTGSFEDAVEGPVFFVDPLDGTKEFIAGKPDYTVNICLVENRVPKIGVVFAPARSELFSTDGAASYRSRVRGDASIEERIAIRASTGGSGNMTAVASASHGSLQTDAFLQGLDVRRRVSIGSSLKFCLVAVGEAHIYPRFGRTMQWDTAAGDAVLRAAGGCTLTSEGMALEYGVPTSGAFENPHFVSYCGCADDLRTLLGSIQRAADARETVG